MNIGITLLMAIAITNSVLLVFCSKYDNAVIRDNYNEIEFLREELSKQSLINKHLIEECEK